MGEMFLKQFKNIYKDQKIGTNQKFYLFLYVENNNIKYIHQVNKKNETTEDYTIYH